MGSLIDVFYSTICQILFFSFHARVDPPVYPHLDIYPAVAGRTSPQLLQEKQSITTSTSGKLNIPRVAYPQLDICELICPELLFRLLELKSDFFRSPLLASV